MARIAGVDLPRGKRIEIALTYIYGIGRPSSQKILNECKISLNKKSDEITEAELSKLKEVIERNHSVEGDRRREVTMAIKRLVDLGCYRGSRHKKGLPVRGQRTHSNARTRKGKAVAIAGKKSIKAMK